MFGLKSNSLFSDTKKLEREIDGFVDILSEVGLVFKSIVPTYLNHSANGKFDELTKGLKEYGIDEKEATEIVNEMKKVNKLQDQRRTLRNKARKARDPNLPNDQLLTIEHIGALKNKWPNIPENRWGLITKKANSRAGARLDPADINIRMQGTPGKGKHGTWVDEKARKVVLDKEMGSDNWDPTRNLPEKIKRKILKAKSIEDIDDILTEFLE